MDEEKEYSTSTGRQGGPVRPSMVIMTSKLLNVSEGIASMNIKIAVGVFLCLILIGATFIVNVVAFDYAKDEARNDSNFVVDKSSAEVIEFHTKTVPFKPELTLESLSQLKEVTTGTSDGSQFFFHVAGVEMSACSEESLTCNDGLKYVVKTTAQRDVNVAKVGSTVVFVLQEALAEVDRLMKPENRHLLQGGSTACPDCSPAPCWVCTGNGPPGGR